MDVHLLVYDLSQGLARQMSMGLLGFQLDAIYHTSILLQGREYVYDGGIVSIVPGSSHLGQPMEKIPLGTTSLPMDVIEEYLDSLRPIFTLEAYDLFRHNCNNFTDSFSNFLLGKGIPSHISSMPQAVMDSPMGRMLVPQLTQGVNASRRNGSILGLQENSQAAPHSANGSAQRSSVLQPTSSADFDRLFEAAKSSCACIFFTSRTCGPCRPYYPVYEQLAEEMGKKAALIKVDIAEPGMSSIAQRYSIRATPTFMTFLKGEQEDQWSGKDPSFLRNKVRLLVEMASPSHPHDRLRLPTFSKPNEKPVLYAKVPPMEKLMAKMGGTIAGKPEVQSLRRYLQARVEDGPQDAILPNLGELSNLVQTSLKDLPKEVLFGVVDLFRCALADPRVSAYFVEEQDHRTLRSVLDLVNKIDPCPYALRLVTLQMTCNLFSTPLGPEQILGRRDLRTDIIALVSSSFLDESHDSVRAAAASLLFNISVAASRARQDSGKPTLPDDDQVELAASVIEAIGQEEKSPDVLHGMLLALGYLVYRTPLDGELADLLRALDAEGSILSKKTKFPQEKLIAELGGEMLGKGLKRP